jgi:hypothetical protein
MLQSQHRPPERPAKRYINDGADDAVGISVGLRRKVLLLIPRLFASVDRLLFSGSP